MRLKLGLASLLLAAGCNDAHLLSVNLRTDLVPYEEFDRVIVAVDGEEVMAADVDQDADYVDGVRLADLVDVPGGSHRLRVMLELTGAPVAEQIVAVELAAATAVTAVITRDCRGVTCDDPVAPACLGGTCVSERCTPETPEHCPDAECGGDADCPAAPADCAVAVCQAGTCLAVDGGGCEADHYCDVEQGCRATRDLPIEPLSVLVSDAPDRSAGRPLDGETLSGAAYLFVEDQPHLTRVESWIDVPSTSTSPPQVENDPPYDIVGNMSSMVEAAPLETSTLADGAHELRVLATFDDGSTMDVQVPFSTSNGLEGLVFSASPYRADPTPLDAASVSGTIYVTYAPGARAVDAVAFFVDDPGRMGESHYENYAPYDLASIADGQGNHGAAEGLATALLGPGTHTVTAELYRGGPDEVITATFEVLP